MISFFHKNRWDTDLDFFFKLFTLAIFACLILVSILYWGNYHYQWNLINDCPFRKYLHFYCPGCGGTRATKALLHFHFIKSFCYHPLPIYCCVVVIIFYTTRFLAIITKGKINICHFHLNYIWISLFFLCLNFIIKNVLIIFFHVYLMG